MQLSAARPEIDKRRGMDGRKGECLTKKQASLIRTFTRRLPSLKLGIMRAIYLPVSPRGFKATVSLLRWLGILRRIRPVADHGVRRILVSYPYGNLGDLVLTLPMIEALHFEWPDATIDVAARARTADLMTGISFVGNVYRFPNRESRIPEFTDHLRVWDAIALYRKQMMQQDYDLAISARWGEDPSFGNYLMYLTGAQRRCGYSASVTNGNLATDRVLTDVATGGHHEQEALRILRLLSRVGLRSENQEDENVITAPIGVLQDISKVQLDRPLLNAIQSKYIVVAPGAMVPRKLWPAENFIGVMERLRQQDDFTFILIGSREEATICHEMLERFRDRAISLAGKTTLHELIAIIANATLFIGNDSGPAHLAGALGIPTVVVNFFPLSCSKEHPSSPARFRPCGPRVAIVQPAEPRPPCYPCCSVEEPHCVRQVSVDQVVSAIQVLTRIR